MSSEPKGAAEPSDVETERGETVAEGDPPARTRLSELMADPPETGVGGGFEGYRAGRRMRRVLFGIVALAVPIAIYSGIRIRHDQAERRRSEEARRLTGAPTYQIAEGGEARSRELVWTSGAARLGLSREPPGVDTIILPDRVLTLGEGTDHAQLKVEVRDGKTVELEVLFGVVVEGPPRTATPQSE
jgi:hypothetical protein